MQVSSPKKGTEASRYFHYKWCDNVNRKIPNFYYKDSCYSCAFAGDCVISLHSLYEKMG